MINNNRYPKEGGSRPKRTGRRPERPGFSIISKGAILPDRLRVARYLEETREELISDLGPRESDLTRGQKVLIDRILSKLGIIRLVEIWVAKHGPMKEDQLRPILESYLSWSRDIRLDLQALGLKTKKKIEDFIDIDSDLEAWRKEKKGSGTNQEESPADSSGGAEIASPESNAAQKSTQEKGAEEEGSEFVCQLSDEEIARLGSGQDQESVQEAGEDEEKSISLGGRRR